MVEVRISNHRWQQLDPALQTEIRELAGQFARDFGYDFEWEYFWIKFTEENYLLARLKEYEAMHYLRVAE